MEVLPTTLIANVRKEIQMNKNFERLTNASVLLAAIVTGTLAVEDHNLWMAAVSLLLTFSYTLFTEKK